MSQTHLITFGCSWTYGIGAGWKPGMTSEEFHEIAFGPESAKFSFRKKLSDKYNLANDDHSHGGSSNQRNFRIANHIFSNQETLRRIKNNRTIVLWGITSTSRSEFWDTQHNTYNNFKLDIAESDNGYSKNARSVEFAKFYLENIYDHDVEVKHLKQNMLLWNNIFAYHDIPVIWYDSFNTHNYDEPIPNLVRPHDLLTEMLVREKVEYVQENKKFYHFSSWKTDDIRIKAATDHALVDPFSMHPTEKGHDHIADMLSPYLEERLKQ